MLSASTTALIHKLKSQKPTTAYSTGDSFIVVNKLTEKAGAAYEKIRYLIDYMDERHIRRSAIERIIKRRIMFEGGEGLGMSLIQELIAGRYLPNNTISEHAVVDVESIISKYRKLESFIPANLVALPRSKKILVRLMASEIEDFFYPNNEDDFVADAFYETVRDSVKIQESISDQALDTQVLIACYRSFLNTDDETLFYKLWLKHLPEKWADFADPAIIKHIGENCVETWDSIHASLQDPLSFKLLPRFYNYGIYFSVIREVIRAYGAESERVLSNHAELKQFAKKFLDENYVKQFKKVRGSAIRAVFYIFLTKMLLALALEVPYQMYFLKTIEYTPIATNLLFHPFLLFLITMSVRPLDQKNTEDIIDGVESVLSGENVRVIKVKVKGSGFFNTLFLFMYTILFLAVFGAIVATLKSWNWSIVSIFLFAMFLTLVSYFALRIRHSANKWKVAKEDDRIITLAFNLFALPIVRAGKWLSRKFSSINFFAFILDFIIETPFKLVLNISDAFVSFLKEKQEDTY